MACKKSFRRRRKMSKGERRRVHGDPPARPQRQRRRTYAGSPTGRERRFSNLSSQAAALMSAGISETVTRQDKYYVCPKCGTQLNGPGSTCRNFDCRYARAEERERPVTETVTVRTNKPTTKQMAQAIAIILAHRAAKRKKNHEKKLARRERQR